MKTRVLLLSAALGSTVLATAQNVNVQLTVGGNIDKTVFSQLDSFTVANTLDLSGATILASTVNGVEYAANEIPDSAFLTKGYTNQNGAFVYTGNKDVQSVTLPASITAIGVSAFNGLAASVVDFSACKQLVTIKEHAFGMGGVDKIDLSGLTALTTIETYAFDQTHASEINLEGCSSLTTLGANAFQQSYFCTSVNFKGCTALKVIPNRAFLNLGKYIGNADYGIEEQDCELDLTPCTALETIDVSAFQSMKFTSIKFPASLKTIGEKAFNLASKIKTITFKGTTPPELGNTAFTKKIMTDATVIVPDAAIDAYKAAGFENVVGAGAAAVSTARIAASSDAPVYDLNGRLVADPVKGLYIQNGQKTIK